MCWFRRYINCSFVCLLNFRPHHFFLSHFLVSLYMLSFLLIYLLTCSFTFIYSFLGVGQDVGSVTDKTSRWFLLVGVNAVTYTFGVLTPEVHPDSKNTVPVFGKGFSPNMYRNEAIVITGRITAIIMECGFDDVAYVLCIYALMLYVACSLMLWC